MNNEGNVKKVCSFCVSDWHFITMLIPYINKKIDENEEVKIYTQQSRFETMRTFLSKLTLNQEAKQKLADLNWNGSKINKYYQIQEEIEKSHNENITFIVEGENSYIEKVNHYIEKYLNKNKKTNKKITIINCYEVMQFNQNIEAILAEHDKILNTAGEKEIQEVFEGYKKHEDMRGVS